MGLVYRLSRTLILVCLAVVVACSSPDDGGDRSVAKGGRDPAVARQATPDTFEFTGVEELR